MNKPLFTIEELLKLGFKEYPCSELDNGDYYRWWFLRKNNCKLEITYEYTKENEFISCYVEINNEQLKGRTLTQKDIHFLIEIM